MSQAFHLNNITLAESTGTRDNGFPHYLYDISTTSLNSRAFRMSRETLDSVAKQANEGIPIYKNHATYSQDPSGYTVSAQRTGNKVQAELYIQPNLSNPDTNDMIARINAGTMRDGSISFLGGEFHCDVCSSIFKLKSDGWFYSFVDENGHTLGQELSDGTMVTALVKGDVDMREFSIAGMGADPGAGIVKKLHAEFGNEPIDIGVLHALAEINGFDVGSVCQHLSMDFDPTERSYSFPTSEKKLFVPPTLSDRQKASYALAREKARVLHSGSII